MKGEIEDSIEDNIVTEEKDGIEENDEVKYITGINKKNSVLKKKPPQLIFKISRNSIPPDLGH